MLKAKKGNQKKNEEKKKLESIKRPTGERQKNTETGARRYSTRSKSTQSSEGTNSQGSRRSSETDLPFEVAEYEGEVNKKLAEVFKAGLSNTVRTKILGFCSEERSYNDLMFTLHLNPGSVSHHTNLLQEAWLMDRIQNNGETRYKITELGSTMLEIAEEVHKIIRQHLKS